MREVFAVFITFVDYYREMGTLACRFGNLRNFHCIYLHYRKLRRW